MLLQRLHDGWLAVTMLGALVPGFASPARAQDVPPHQRVVLVIMENKSYDQTRFQPYTASLIAKGATLTNSAGVTHPSQPNYFALWAANTLGVTNNNCPPAGAPFSDANLGQACEAAGLTWKVYAENLPAAGSTVCSADGSASSGLYTRKHAPWTYFTNLDHSRERPYSELAADLAADTLPSLSVILPNNCHNSHNSSTPGCTVPDADTWLSANLPPLIAALGPDGALILTWDEDDSASNNHILTVIVGPHAAPGSASGRAVTHYTVTRTICEMLRIPAFANAVTESPVTDIWSPAVPVLPTSWGRLKTMYR